MRSSFAEGFRDLRWLKRQGARLSCVLDQHPVFGLLPAPCAVLWTSLPLTGHPAGAALSEAVCAHTLSRTYRT